MLRELKSSLSIHYYLLNLLILFFPLMGFAGISGYIGEVKVQGENVEITGWACDVRVNKSINVHFYVESHDGTSKKMLAGVKADEQSGEPVNEACQTSGINHRFLISLSKRSLMGHRRKKIYIYGISERHPNSPLTHSGNVKIPNFAIPTSWIARKSNNDLVIPAQTMAYIDEDILASVIDVKGHLVCPTNANRKIVAKGILISGKLTCGQPNNPIRGKITFKLMKGRELIHHMNMGGHQHHHSMGERAFAVVSGGTLQMQGEGGRHKWTRLSQTVGAGSKIIKLSDAVAWKEGDRIGIAPTGFDYQEAEERIIARKVSNTEYELDRPLSYGHYGVNNSYSKGDVTWSLKSSAEVGNMTRNIVVTTADLSDSGADQYIGAHMMVMRGGKAYLDNVELAYMGQAGEMARYPFHWHLAKDVSGQFIKNSSIHHSFQRCITVHGTNNANVYNNFCFDHRGHGIFLEDGNEKYNRIQHNLVMLSKKPYEGRALLASDIMDGQNLRFQPTSAYWISHPLNIVTDNVSAGSIGTGFWMSYEEQRICDRIDGSDCSIPAKGKTLAFNYNVAKVNRVGMTWDGARTTTSAYNPNNPEDTRIDSSTYLPPEIPTFTGNQSMLALQSCFYTRSSTMVFNRTASVECGWHHFHAFNIRLNNSIMVGEGPFPKNDKYRTLIALHAWKGRYGAILYDGPFEYNNVLFKNFPQKEEFYTVSGQSRRISSIPFGAIGGANKYTNRVKNLIFQPEPLTRVDFNPSVGEWADYHVSQSLLDQDGSLTGQANSIVTVKNGFNYVDGCSVRNKWNALVCDASRYKFGNLIIHDFSNYAMNNDLQNKFFFNTIRNNQHSVHDASYDESAQDLHSKVNILTDANQRYDVDLEGQNLDKKTLRYITERGNERSNLVVFRNMAKPNCQIHGAIRVDNFQDLAGYSQSAYYISGGKILVRFLPNSINERFTGNIKPRIVSHSVTCR